MYGVLAIGMKAVAGATAGKMAGVWSRSPGTSAGMIEPSSCARRFLIA
jgi:hypothetical protein